MSRPTPLEGELALVADIGATNARFALVRDHALVHSRVLRAAEHPSLASAIGAYLDAVQPDRPPRQAAIAFAGPIEGDRVTLTNHAWSFSLSALRDQLALDRLEVINDFTAIALGLPHLDEGDRRQIGPGRPVAGFPIGVLGPGTGLGMSGLVPVAGGWQPLSAEGGHVTMASVDAREDAVIQRLRLRYSHVSAERVLSGMGLVNLYETLAALDGEDDAPTREPRDVTEGALAGDPICTEAVEMFCAMLGTVAGNLALSLGSLGGVYVAGGIVPRLGDRFDRSAFRERFEAKGRFRSYLTGIPTWLVTHPVPAFLGLRALLERDLVVAPGGGTHPPSA